MNYGRYFKLDEEASFVERGVAVFQYRRDNRIYVTFTANNIVFFAVSSENANVPVAKPAEDSSRGTSHLLLRFSVDDDLGKRIASTRQDDFDAQIEGHWNWPDRLSYASTFRFAKPKKRKDNKLAHPGGYQPPETFPARNLILDFLFDFEETRIFRMSPNHEELLAKLRENFFARCLSAKARYCYQEAFYRGLLKESKGASAEQIVSARRARKDRLKFYGRDCFRVEKEWIECIRDPRSDKTFMDSNGWFESSEAEMRRIYRPLLPIKLERGAKEEKDKNDNLSSKWFVARYVWLFPLMVGVFYRPFRGLHLLIPRLLFSIGSAWLAIVFWQAKDAAPSFYKNNQAFYIGIVIASLLGASWITLRRTLPLAKGVLGRTLKLSFLILFFSLLVGCLFKPMDFEFIFFWGSAAFTGMVINFFFANKNPSESL